MAIAERMAAARYNVAGAEPSIVDHRTWIFCGDGDMKKASATRPARSPAT